MHGVLGIQGTGQLAKEREQVQVSMQYHGITSQYHSIQARLATVSLANAHISHLTFPSPPPESYPTTQP